MKIIFRPAAQEDLETLYDYIAIQVGLEKAGLYIERVEKACMALKTFPERGTIRNWTCIGKVERLFCC